jgi:signal peptidase I
VTPSSAEAKSRATDAERESAATEESGGILTLMREWSDALVFAFVIAMFVRVFVVELFKIPTGSMSPTLLGDKVAYVDYNQDGLDDIVVVGSRTMAFVTHREGGSEWHEAVVDPHIRELDIYNWEREGRLRPQYDRILVNKFAYWLASPQRGDVVVFKVPKPNWSIDKPIYIKRVTGLGGERLSFDGPLKVDGREVEDPPFFRHQRYINTVSLDHQGSVRLSYAKYRPGPGNDEYVQYVDVPQGGVFVMGDNTHSSLDSRFWGVVPLAHLKGRAFIRYWPFSKMKFIH